MQMLIARIKMITLIDNDENSFLCFLVRDDCFAVLYRKLVSELVKSACKSIYPGGAGGG